VDSSPIGTNTGTVNGGVTLGVSGKLNSAGSFDQSSGYIDMGNAASLQISSGTISAWVKTVQAGGGVVGGIVVKDGGIGMFNYQGQYCVYDWTGPGFTASGVDLNDDNWHQVAFTFQSGVSDGSQMYVDGGAAGSAFTYTIGTQTIDLLIGYGDSPSQFFGGTIDEVAVWNTVLSATDIATIYVHQNPIYSGVFTSRVMDSYYTGQIWESLGWTTNLPFFKALPNSGVSETSGNYSSQSASLMSDIVGLWHMDEASWNGTSGEVVDSANSNNGTSGGTATTVSTGLFDRAGTFSGGPEDYISLPSGTTPANNYTVSVWINPKAYGGELDIYSFGPKSGCNPSSQFLAMESYYISYYVGCGGNFTTPDSVPLDRWSNVVLTVDGSDNATGYLNGKLEAGPANYSGGQSLGTGNDLIGVRWSGGSLFGQFDGLIDEVAVWNRVLTSAEVLELYRRGANRIKYQIQSCSVSATCTSSPNWMGPDGTDQSYFSELYNTTTNTLGDTVLAGLASMLFSEFGSLSLPNNEFFQYRAIMESDDTNGFCNYGSGPDTAPCSPELQTVNVGSTN